MVAKAFLDLYQVTFDKQWLDLSEKLTQNIIQNFKDENSNFYFYTHNENDELSAKTMELSDNVIPASNSVVANLLFDLGHILYKEDYVDKSKKMLKAVLGSIADSPAFYSNWARLLGKAERGISEAAIVGSEAQELAHQMQKEYLPNCLFIGGEIENLPLLKGKLAENTTIYVCKDKVCKMPTTKVEEAMGQILR